MAIIQSGTSTDLLTVDPTSKAARVTIYDSNGNIASASHPSSEIIQSNVTITASGNALFTNVDSSSVSLFINIEAIPTGTSPTLTYTVAEVDPTDKATVIGQTVTGAPLNSVTTQVLTIQQIKSNTIRVSWVLGGTSSPTFTQVNSVIVGQDGSSSTVIANIGTTGGVALDATLIGGTSKTQIYDGTNIIGTSSHPVKTDPTGTTTQPVSGTVAVTQSTSPWAVSGTVTSNAGTGNFTVVQPTASNLNANVSGAVTANIGTTNGIALDTSVNGILLAQGSTTSGETGPLIQGAVTTAAPTYTTGKTDPLSLTTAGALRVDGSGVTQPISGTVTANAGSGTFTVAGTVTSNMGTTGGLALDATLTGGTAKFEQFDGTNVIGTAAHPVRMDPTGTTTQPVNGTVTANAGSGTFVVSGTVTSNIGTTNGLALDTSVNGILVSQGSTTAGQHGNLTQGAVTTVAPTYTTAQTSPLSLTTAGALRTDASATTQPVSGTVTANAGSGTFSVSGTINQGTANTAPNSWLVEVTDGTNVLGVSAHPIRIDPTGTTTQPVSGTVTANAGSGTFTVSGTVTSNIGTTNGLALDATLTGGTSKTQVFDGTNVIGTATHPVRTDPTGTTTQPVSGTVTANIGTSGSLALDATVAKLTVAQGAALGSNTQALVGGSVTTVAPTYTTGNIDPLSLTTSGLLRVDGSGVTQPVSGTVTSNIGTTNGLALDATLTGGTAKSQIFDGTNVIGTTAHPVKTDPTGTTTQPVSGTVTANAGSGTFTVSGTVTSNIGTTNGLALDTSVNGLLVSQGSTTSGEKGTLIQGAVTTASPTYTTAQTSPLSLTTAGALRVDASSVTQPVSGTITANQGGTWTVQPGNTANTTPWLSTINQGGNSATVSAGGALKVDGSATTQPVSGTVTANAGSGTFSVSGTVTSNIGTTNGLALDTSVNGILLSQGSTTSGQKGNLIQGAVTTAAPTYTTAQTSPLSLTTAGAVRVDGSGVTQPVSGTVTANAGTGTFAVSGTVTSNIGTTNGLALDTSVNGVLVSQGSTTSGEKGPLIQGAVTTSAPTYTTAQTSPLSLTTAGALRTDASATTQPVSGTVTANAGTGSFTVAQATAANLNATVTGTVTANQGGAPWSENITQFGGTNISTGTGASGTGIPRVTVANDSNILATQSGTWTVQQGSPNTATNSWPVEITDGTNILGTQSHPVVIDFLDDVSPATQNITAQDIASTTTAFANGQNFITGTATAGSAASFAITTFQTIKIMVSGVWTGTVTTEISLDSGTTWVASDVHQTGSPYTMNTFTANFIGGLNVSGCTNFRVRAVAAWTGTATIRVVESDQTNSVYVASPTTIRDSVIQSNLGTIKSASTASISADPSLVVALSPNSTLFDANGNAMLRQNRTAVPSTLGVSPIAGLDGGQTIRTIRLGEHGTQRVTSEVLLWHDAFESSTVNTFWTQSVTTQTIAQATGVLTLNNSNITTVNTDSIITSQRQFPKYPRQPLYGRWRALITANVASNHTLVELGFGAPSGVTAIITNGVFFRWTAAGNLNAVISYNGTEQSTQVLAQGTIVTTSYYYYDIILDDDFVRFIVSDSSGIAIVDTQISLTLTVPLFSAVSHDPVFSRVYVDATGGGTAIQFKLAAHSVQMLDGVMTKTWEQQLAACMRHASINPTTYAQTGSSMTATPATETPSNTVGGYNALGGDYAIALTVASENPLSVFAFQIPSPYSFYLTGLTFSVPFPTTVFATTLIPALEWLVIANCASGNISTGGGQRFPIGLNFQYTSATQITGTLPTVAGSLVWTPKVPIICLPGTFLHIAYKVFITSAVSTAGVQRGSVFVDGFFE